MQLERAKNLKRDRETKPAVSGGGTGRVYRLLLPQSGAKKGIPHQEGHPGMSEAHAEMQASPEVLHAPRWGQYRGGNRGSDACPNPELPKSDFRRKPPPACARRAAGGNLTKRIASRTPSPRAPAPPPPCPPGRIP